MNSQRLPTKSLRNNDNSTLEKKEGQGKGRGKRRWKRKRRGRKEEKGEEERRERKKWLEKRNKEQLAVVAIHAKFPRSAQIWKFLKFCNKNNFATKNNFAIKIIAKQGTEFRNIFYCEIGLIEAEIK